MWLGVSASEKTGKQLDKDAEIKRLKDTLQELDKDAEIAKFNETAKKLSEHIAELETKDTKSGHLIETTAAEKLRLSEELKVATQQLDMMREVTRQLYSKITEQVRTHSAGDLVDIIGASTLTAV